MAKITDLTNYPVASASDVMPIVDITNNTTKKISIGNLIPVQAERDWLIHLHTNVVNPADTTGTWTRSSGAGWNEASWLSSSTGSDGSSIKFRFYLDVGTFFFSFMYTGGADKGKQDIAVTRLSDATSVYTGTDDLYRSSNTQISYTSTDVVIAEAGLHEFKFTINGKNASSSGYGGAIMSIGIVRKS